MKLIGLKNLLDIQRVNAEKLQKEKTWLNNQRRFIKKKMKFVFGSGEGIVVKRQRGEWLAFLVCCMRNMQK